MSDVNAETQIQQGIRSLEARIVTLEHQVNALQRLVTIPGPGEPGYDEALAKELPYWEEQDAKERAAGNPPTWTPRRRAAAAFSRTRDFAKRYLQQSKP